MTGFTDFLVKEIIGPGNRIEDANPVPIVFRGTPVVVGGVQRTTPAGAEVPTGSPVSTIHQPR
jgi:hypothetical protein